MAWQSDKPGDSEKIRSLGTVIRPNWVSIEQGEDANAMSNSNSGAYLQQYSVALIERDGRANNDDPTTEAETFFVYCKQNTTSGLAEGHVKTPAGDAIQITEGDNLGSVDTTVHLESLSFENTGTPIVYDENNLIRAWAILNSGSAAAVKNVGFPGTFTPVTTGLITIDVTGMGPAGANFASGNDYGVTATAAFVGRVHVASVLTKTATSFQIYTRNDQGTESNVEFTVTIMS